jgi:hypothetical protein
VGGGVVGAVVGVVGAACPPQEASSTTIARQMQISMFFLGILSISDTVIHHLSLDSLKITTPQYSTGITKIPAAIS